MTRILSTFFISSNICNNSYFKWQNIMQYWTVTRKLSTIETQLCLNFEVCTLFILKCATLVDWGILIISMNHTLDNREIYENPITLRYQPYYGFNKRKTISTYHKVIEESSVLRSMVSVTCLQATAYSFRNCLNSISTITYYFLSARSWFVSEKHSSPECSPKPTGLCCNTMVSEE